MGPLSGKTALVTGGSRGIGRAICRQLAEQGAEIVLHYNRNRAAAEETAAAIGAGVKLVQADMSSIGEIESMFAGLGDLPLDFGSLATVNVRLFADLGRMPSVVKKFPFLKGSRLSLGVNNLFDGQQKVTDSTGATPLRYQAGYIDPTGRLIKLELRKQF